ncbi:MAG: hypothetical protein AAFY60_19315, partial [Myxococcota bacterium]
MVRPLIDGAAPQNVTQPETGDASGPLTRDLAVPPIPDPFAVGAGALLDLDAVDLLPPVLDRSEVTADGLAPDHTVGACSPGQQTTAAATSFTRVVR